MFLPEAVAMPEENVKTHCPGPFGQLGAYPDC